MSPRRPRHATPAAGFLPDVCTASATLPLVLVAALVALALAVARAAPAAFWGELGRLALFCEFLMLASAMVLCRLRRPLAKLGVGGGSAVALAALVLTAWGVAEGAWFLLGAYGVSRAPGVTAHVIWVGRIVVVAAVVDVLVLRYLYVAAEWRDNIRREATSRLEALTARIRPHFLFNTLNTAAALVADQPTAAEHVLEDLAELFRASLRERGTTVPLSEEVEIARRYLAIESLRLGERLHVVWEVTPEAGAAALPPLLLQTLVENAVTHGVEPLAAGGTVRVAARRKADRLLLEVENPSAVIPPDGRHGIGLAGLRARLALAFAGTADVKAGARDGAFVVSVSCPWISGPLEQADADTDR